MNKTEKNNTVTADIKENNIKTFKKIKRILNYISKIISYACIVLLIIIGSFLVYYMSTVQKAKNDPSFKPKVSLYTIISGSMEPTIHVYDVVVNIATKSPEDIKVGDVITFISTSSISEGLTVTHRVQDIKIVNGEYEYITKGDYNPTADSSSALYSNVIGKVAFKIPQLGKIQFFVASRAGWFFVVLLPAMGVIIYDVLKLFKLLGTKTTSDKITTKKKKTSGDLKVDKAVENIVKKDYTEDTIDKIKNDLQNNEINTNINNENDKEIKDISTKTPEIKEEESKDYSKIIVQKDSKNTIDTTNNKKNQTVNLTKKEYLNRFNALKNKNNTK